jgi:hypothetical protein
VPHSPLRSVRPRRSLGALTLLAVAAIAVPASASAADDGEWHVLDRPVAPTQQTALAFGDRSHWLQPWRAYQDTRPASSLADAAAINLNVAPAEIARTAETLAAAGVRRVRVEIGWDQMSYDDPSTLATSAHVDEGLQALKDAGIRPLILLNASENSPTANRRDRLTVTKVAWLGARQVTLDAASAAKVVPGRTGFDAGTLAGGLIITKLDGTTATLSQPLPLAVILPGSYGASTLRYRPFAAPRTTTGAPNPLFEETMEGWLRYVRAVTRTAASVLGGSGFDVEVWNELSTRSGFLDASRYFNPLPAEWRGTGDVPEQLLARTAAAIRDPANGTPGVGIGNGFANQTPFASPADLPPGVTALDKHPYKGLLRFPGQLPTTDRNVRTLGADGSPLGKRASNGQWQTSFNPTYDAFLPEYYLTGIQTEHLVRDLSPITTSISGRPHGRTVRTQDGRLPQVWITETGMDPAGTGLTGDAVTRMQAKATLRGLVAYVGAGADLVSFYTAKADRTWGLISDAFFTSASRTGRAAADDPSLVGPMLPALGRLLRTVGRGPPADRRLELRSIADQHDRIQFAGNGTPQAPDLHDRDVVTFFPFQQSAHRFSIATYVMTRSLAKVQQPDLPEDDARRYDLAPETFRLRIGGVDADRTRVSLYDPLTDESAPASIVERSDDEVVVELSLTDAPRLLQVDDGPTGD